MKIVQIAGADTGRDSDSWPSPDAIAALRAWVEGIPAPEVAARYWTAQERMGRNARGLIAGVKRQLGLWATARGRPDLADAVAALRPTAQSRSGLAALLSSLHRLPPATPLIGDEVGRRRALPGSCWPVACERWLI